MLTQICKIAPELAQLTSKIGPVLAFSDNYLSFLIDFVKIELIEYNKKNQNVIRLLGHQKSIKCLKFSRENSKEKLLCSCSSDSLILWDIKKILEGKELDGKLIGRSCFEYEPTNCCFDPTNQVIAVSNAFLINLYDINTCSQFGEIKLDDCINFFEYSLFNHNLIIISTQTNLLMCHDLSKNETINSIQNTSNNSFLNIASLENEPILLVSSTDGSIHSYKFKTEKFLLLNKINLVQIYVDFLKQNKNDENIDRSGLSVCTGLQVFRINDQAIISCATSTCLFLIDFYTNNLIYLIDLKNIPLAKSNESIIPQMAEFSLLNSKQINVALLFLFQNEIKVFKCADIQANQIEMRQANNFNQDADFGENYLSVHPKKALNKDSPLSEGVVDKEVVKPKLATSMHEYLKTNNITKKNSISAKDKPITFTSKIKSSGYNSVVKREKFTPLINKKSSSMISLDNLNSSRQKQGPSKLESRIKQFKFEIPTILCQKVNSTDKSSPLTLLRYSDDGNYFAAVSNDNLIQYIPSNNLEKTVQVYNGHNETIRSVDISHDGKLLLSASDDKSTKLWSLKKPMDLLIDIKSIKLSDSTSFNIRKPVNAASFFYLDKFLLLGTDKNLFLCKYHIDSNKNDLQRYLNNSFVKSVKKFELTFAQSITTVSTINSFYSYLVLCGGTDKSIEVFDMNEARSCLTIHEAHSRPFHQLSQNQSDYNSLSYDLFISNAVADGIKLWDLRNAKCVSRLDSHINRYLPTKVSFSPDSFYVCAGSEDRSALVYDLRMNGIVKKYGVFSDNVSCAQFNPKKSQLLCGTQDGKIYDYHIN